MSKNNQQIINSFYNKNAIKINTDRIQHLDSLKLDFNNKKILETGCGGIGQFTKYLVNNGAIVTLNDARIDNILANLNNNKYTLNYNTWDLNKPINTDEIFDIIFCYGTLYHLTEPELAIKSFAKLCKEYIIISTCTNGKNDESINIVYESNTPEQGFHSYGCRPGRLFIYNKLKENFKYVYTLKTQPNNEDYPLKFPSSHSASRNIFIGSHIIINNPNVCEELRNNYEL